MISKHDTLIMWWRNKTKILAFRYFIYQYFLQSVTKENHSIIRGILNYLCFHNNIMYKRILLIYVSIYYKSCVCNFADQSTKCTKCISYRQPSVIYDIACIVTVTTYFSYYTCWCLVHNFKLKSISHFWNTNGNKVWNQLYASFLYKES